MLTFEYDPENVLELNLDEAGRRTLIDILARLSPGDHDHLMTEAWGGGELTEEFPNPELIPIHKLTIQLVTTTSSDSGLTRAAGHLMPRATAHPPSGSGVRGAPSSVAETGDPEISFDT